MFQKSSNKFLKIAVVLVIIFFILIGIIIGVEKYKFWKGTKNVEKLAENLEKMKQLDYELAMADTYGGKTPQETLDMFISAVEKGNYELASKYFVIAKQEEWKKMLKKAENIDEFLKEVKQVKENINTGKYSEQEDWFRVDKPVVIEFMRYPNGVWKIIEI